MPAAFGDMADDGMNFRLKGIGELPEFLLTVLVTGFDVAGDRQIHVETDGLNDGAEDALQFRRLPAVAIDGGGHEFSHRQGIAADIPARLQPDSLVRGADGDRAVQLRLVEGAREQTGPVAALGALQMIDRHSRQHGAGIGIGRHMSIETLQQLRQRRFQDGSESL